MNRTFLLIDGNNLAFRCFYGVTHLSNPNGMPVNAIYGFIHSLWMLEEQVPSAIGIVCFDHGRSEKRLQLLQDYKANRSPTPEAFKVQMLYIQEVVPFLGMLCCKGCDVEADDWIGSWSNFAVQSHDQAVIASADKDMMQCVNARVRQMIPTAQGWSSLDEQGVFKKMGVYPHQIVDYLSLIGDYADHYGGIPGVGPKTAARWLNDYGSLEKILQHTATLQPERFRSILEQSRVLLQRNQQLAMLDGSQDRIEPMIPQLDRLQPNPEAFEKLLRELHLEKLLRKWQERRDQKPQQAELFSVLKKQDPTTNEDAP
ncbi:MAG: 5'-3' exonuclease [Opitutales bacterium]|nr:5'-3' exonuclease [Opitutales bacterium]